MLAASVWLASSFRNTTFWHHHGQRECWSRCILSHLSSFRFFRFSIPFRSSLPEQHEDGPSWFWIPASKTDQKYKRTRFVRLKELSIVNSWRPRQPSSVNEAGFRNFDCLFMDFHIFRPFWPLIMIYIYMLWCYKFSCCIIVFWHPKGSTGAGLSDDSKCVQ